MKKIFKVLIYSVLSLILLFGLFLGFNTLKDYKPAPEELIAEDNGTVINVYDTLNFLNWNIGYCGLGADMDFFYDGGEHTRTTEERTQQNYTNIASFLKQNDSIDFYLLLQRADLDLRQHFEWSIYFRIHVRYPTPI